MVVHYANVEIVDGLNKTDTSDYRTCTVPYQHIYGDNINVIFKVSPAIAGLGYMVRIILIGHS